MTRRLLLLSVILLLALPTAAASQGQPDFSGTWKLVASNPVDYKGSNGWAVPSPTMVISQTPTELTIDSGQYGRTPMKVVYKLDGSETIWEAPWVTQAAAPLVTKWRTKVRWDGTKLILMTWNMALNQTRDILTVSRNDLTISRATEQPGPSTNAVLTYKKGS